MGIQFGDNRLPERFWKKVVIYPGSGCWLWTAGKYGSRGYAAFKWEGRTRGAHRIAYETLCGPVGLCPETGEALQLDHVVARGCIARHCVNPAHLEPVTHAVNSSRERKTTQGLAKQTEIGQLVGSLTAARNLQKTHCPQGHPYSGDNLYIVPSSGFRQCRTCAKQRNVHSD
jgi:hypothetical protein